MSRIKRIGRTFTSCVGKSGTIDEDQYTKPEPKKKAEDEQQLIDVPGSPRPTDEFYERVRRDAVAVDPESLNHTKSKIIGFVGVRNDSPEKCVMVRYTTNEWETHDEVNAEWVESTEDQIYDKFRFSIPLTAPYTVYLAVRYEVLDQQYWDNNDHHNYKIVQGCESNKSKS